MLDEAESQVIITHYRFTTNVTFSNMNKPIYLVSFGIQLEKGGGLWMNPEAPVTVNSDNYGTERDVANCPFFLKTGACRFGDRSDLICGFVL